MRTLILRISSKTLGSPSSPSSPFHRTVSIDSRYLCSSLSMSYRHEFLLSGLRPPAFHCSPALVWGHWRTRLLRGRFSTGALPRRRDFLRGVYPCQLSGTLRQMERDQRSRVTRRSTSNPRTGVPIIVRIDTSTSAEEHSSSKDQNVGGKHKGLNRLLIIVQCLPTRSMGCRTEICR